MIATDLRIIPHTAPLLLASVDAGMIFAHFLLQAALPEEPKTEKQAEKKPTPGPIPLPPAEVFLIKSDIACLSFANVVDSTVSSAKPKIDIFFLSCQNASTDPKV